MTPLSTLLARWLPKPLQVPALALVYAILLACIVISSRHDFARIIYVDVRGG